MRHNPKAKGDHAGAHELRKIVNVLNNTPEDFNDRYTTLELVRLVRWCMASPYDVTPDQLPPACVREALRKPNQLPSQGAIDVLALRLGE